MGLIYSSEDSEKLINTLKNNINNGKETINQLKVGSQKIVSAVDGKMLSGVAYTAGKGLFSDLVIPTISRVTTAFDNLETELRTYETANEKISGESYLDEDNLMRQLSLERLQKTSLETSIQVMKTMAKSNPVASILDSLLGAQRRLKRMVDKVEASIKKTEKKLDKLHQFSSDTRGLFDTSSDDLKITMQGVLVLNNTTVNADGTYQLPPGVDMSWFKKVKNTDKLTSQLSKEEYIKMLQKEFGFDEKTAKQIFKLKDALDKKFSNLSQQERDYLYIRILGEFSYKDGLKEILMWDNTAGSLMDYFFTMHEDGNMGSRKETATLKDIMKQLGFSNQEFKELSYNLRLQHSLSVGKGAANKLTKAEYKSARDNFEKVYGKGSKERFEEFWNSKVKIFSDNGDFTHQSITTATILDEKWRVANLHGVISGRYDSTHVDELAGWRGDTTTAALKQPSIGNDDYKADLDAVNITQRMKNENIDYQTASNQYYNDLAKGVTNRAEEFKENADFDYVKIEILNDLAPQAGYTEQQRLDYND